MKMNNRTLLLTVIGVLAGLLLLTLVVLTVLTVGERQKNAATDLSSNVIETRPDAPDVEIETPYCTLYYPGVWGEYLKVRQSEGVEYTVSFAAKLGSKSSLKLFSLIFTADPQGAAEMLLSAAGEPVYIRVEINEFTLDDGWTEAEVKTVHAMREALNHVMEKLPTDEQDAGEMTIDTPYCLLYYPAKWASYLDIRIDEQDGYNVAFYGRIKGHEDQHLFTLCFGGTAGIHAASINNGDGTLVELRIIISQFTPDDTWAKTDSSIIYAMQEDLNYLLEKLP